MVASPIHRLTPPDPKYFFGERKGRGGISVRGESFIEFSPKFDNTPIDGGDEGVAICRELETLSGELNVDRIEPVDLGFDGLLLTFDPLSMSIRAKRPYEKGPQTESDNP